MILTLPLRLGFTDRLIAIHRRLERLLRRHRVGDELRVLGLQRAQRSPAIALQRGDAFGLRGERSACGGVAHRLGDRLLRDHEEIDRVELPDRWIHPEEAGHAPTHARIAGADQLRSPHRSPRAQRLGDLFAEHADEIVEERLVRGEHPTKPRVERRDLLGTGAAHPLHEHRLWIEILRQRGLRGGLLDRGRESRRAILDQLLRDEPHLALDREVVEDRLEHRLVDHLPRRRRRPHAAHELLLHRLRVDRARLDARNELRDHRLEHRLGHPLLPAPLPHHVGEGLRSDESPDLDDHLHLLLLRFAALQLHHALVDLLRFGRLPVGPVVQLPPPAVGQFLPPRHQFGDLHPLRQVRRDRAGLEIRERLDLGGRQLALAAHLLEHPEELVHAVVADARRGEHPRGAKRIADDRLDRPHRGKLQTGQPRVQLADLLLTVIEAVDLGVAGLVDLLRPRFAVLLSGGVHLLLDEALRLCHRLGHAKLPRSLPTLATKRKVAVLFKQLDERPVVTGERFADPRGLCRRRLRGGDQGRDIGRLRLTEVPAARNASKVGQSPQAAPIAERAQDVVGDLRGRADLRPEPFLHRVEPRRKATLLLDPRERLLDLRLHLRDVEGVHPGVRLRPHPRFDLAIAQALDLGEVAGMDLEDRVATRLGHACIVEPSVDLRPPTRTREAPFGALRSGGHERKERRHRDGDRGTSTGTGP